MFCSNCGAYAGGNFCSACGHALAAGDAGSAQVVVAEIVPIDWRQEICYERLISVPEVRQRIAEAGKMHRKRMSAEEFLDTFDKLVPLGVSMAKLAELAVPLYSKLGLNAGKTSRIELAMQPGEVLLGVLCAMAKGGNELKEVQQSADGCAIQATIPSTIWSFGGDLVVTVRRAPTATVVEATTKLPGQYYDWGKSQRLLDELFANIPAFAA